MDWYQSYHRLTNLINTTIRIIFYEDEEKNVNIIYENMLTHKGDELNLVQINLRIVFILLLIIFNF